VGRIRFGVPEDVLAAVRDHTAVATAVETGTYRGESTVVLARWFERVWSCEPELGPLVGARCRIERDGLADRVTLVRDDSARCMPDLLTRVTGPALFWFDAHWSPWMPVDDRPQTPVRAELDAVAAWPHAPGSVVLVDDVSVFRDERDDPRYRDDEWPTLDELVARLDAIGCDRVEIVDDVLVGAPAALPPVGSPVRRPASGRR
jgi:hypothetical protein